ncbi:hypothetical protein CERSUDRAFT_100808 [Gelatoporia subvermispora B]|uniref:Uncharacterized protein n=1 Tax=Ceriporiopsis subvermispora (strain B) TaxID=914234 RepID=M2QYL6_CERS8|nr:hypothetical protein CERSUDRAFT_100808 [Gelatoporia subvermispora B]
MAGGLPNTDADARARTRQGTSTRAAALLNASSWLRRVVPSSTRCFCARPTAPYDLDYRVLCRVWACSGSLFLRTRIAHITTELLAHGRPERCFSSTRAMLPTVTPSSVAIGFLLVVHAAPATRQIPLDTLDPYPTKPRVASRSDGTFKISGVNNAKLMNIVLADEKPDHV